MKKGIRYLRYSSAGQSHGSIESQDMSTLPWFAKNKVELIDTYIDAGYSAKTFDRPDMAKLASFIAKNKEVDYLVVNEMDRFSRDAGEALTMAKMLQVKYNVQIVSVCEGITFDYQDNSSYFRMGLSLLLAEDDNIRRANKINSGIYTAKAAGRYIHGKPPYGYRKEGSGKEAALVINEEEAKVVKYIYDAFLKNTPLYKMREEARKMGFPFTSNSYGQKMLSLPIYSGQQQVKPWKDFAGGLYPANHEAIIDLFTWQKVQQKIKGVPKIRSVVSDEMPLRGVLRCHCGRVLTGAPSTGRHGKLFYYYKCHTSKLHKDIPAKKLREQVDEMMLCLTLPPHFIDEILNKCKAIIEEKLKENKKMLGNKKRDLQKVEVSLQSLEEKFINNLVAIESYNRWFVTYTQQIAILKSDIEKYSADYNGFFIVLNNNLDKLTNMQNIYNRCNTLQKQELVTKIFADKLYYKEGVFNTAYIMKAFAPNLPALKQRSLLIVDEKAVVFKDPPPGSSTNLLELTNEDLELITFIANINVNNTISVSSLTDHAAKADLELKTV